LIDLQNSILFEVPAQRLPHVLADLWFLSVARRHCRRYHETFQL
jgi:hypothetical protein